MDRLRSPGGCPWDAEQTHASLARYLLEEAYEAFEAIEDGDLDGLREELGDVLLQVVFHARLAAERPPPEGWDIDDVAAGLVDKLVRRHPHVFGEVEVRGAADVETNWAAIKKAEKARQSAVEGIPLSQPALTLAAKLQRRAESVGVPADLLTGPGDEVTAEGAPAGASEHPPAAAGAYLLPARPRVGRPRAGARRHGCSDRRRTAGVRPREHRRPAVRGGGGGARGRRGCRGRAAGPLASFPRPNGGHGGSRAGRRTRPRPSRLGAMAAALARPAGR